MTQLPSQLQEQLDTADQETLNATIDYAKSRLAELQTETEDDSQESPTEPPEEFGGDADTWAEAVKETTAPSRATLTTKRINDNEYLYWQWSKDGSTKSEYIAPKNPKQ